MTAICIIIIIAVLSTFVTLIRNYKKRRKYDSENGGPQDGRPPIKVGFCIIYTFKICLFPRILNKRPEPAIRPSIMLFIFLAPHFQGMIEILCNAYEH